MNAAGFFEVILFHHMVMRIQELKSNDGTIRLEILQNLWTKCYWQTEDKNIYLGANDLAYLVKHLSAIRSKCEADISGEIEGRKVCWVLSLFEVHHTLYAAEDKTGITIFIQDAQAKIADILNLSFDQYEEWKSLLEGVRDFV